MANYVSIIPDGETVDALLTTVQNSNLSATHKITRSATIVIAASDSSEKSKAQADYVCDGIDDQVEINAAIAALPTTGNVNLPGHGEATDVNQGGNVLLLEGSYNLTAPIDASGKSNVTLEGIGPASIIYNSATDGSNAIQAINTGSPKNRIVIRNLTVLGNASSGDGIHLREINYQKIEDVYCLSNGGHGIAILGDTEAGNAENKIITNVQCLFNKLDGLHIESMGAEVAVHETLIANSHFEENYRYNIGLFKTIDMHIDNCSIEDCHGTYNLYSENTHQLKISNSVIEGDMSIGAGTNAGDVLIANSTWNTLTTPTAIRNLYITTSIGKISNAIVGSLYASSSWLYFRNTNTITGDCLTIEGGVIKSALGAIINLSGAQCRFSVVGSNVQEANLTLGISGTPAGTRLIFNSNHVRTSTINIGNFAFAQMNNNIMIGSGACNVSGMSGVLMISNNILSNFPVTVDNTCSPTAKQFLNNLGGSVTDNSV
jgi:hypothetical protein